MREKQKTIRKCRATIQIKRRKIQSEDYLILKEKKIVELNKEILLEQEDRINCAKKSKLNLKLVKMLPEVIVEYIKGFISYDVRYHILDQKYKPLKLLNRLSITSLNAIIYKIGDSPKFFETLTVQEADVITRHRRLGVLGYCACTNLKDSKIMVNSLIYYMKIHCPHLALKWLKSLSILVNPKKKYNTSRENLMIV
jgi:hypothetical protein